MSQNQRGFTANGAVSFLILFFFCAAVFLSAEDAAKGSGRYYVQVWDSAAGLPGGAIYAILQTRDGYLWLGTRDGLVRFDGVDFEIFSQENTPQLKDNNIRALFQDKSGALWIGTESGGLSRYKDGEFTLFPASTYTAFNQVRAISEDNRGSIWVASLSAGLTCFSNGNVTTYTTTHGLPGNEVRTLFKDNRGDLWVTTLAGVVKMAAPGRFQPLPNQHLLPDTKTVYLHDETTGESWLGTNEGLFRLKGGKPTPYKLKAHMPHPMINTLFLDSKGTLWIGSDEAGLACLSRGRLDTFPGSGKLSDGYVYAVTEDREGSVWVGTLFGGLYRLRESLFGSVAKADGLVHDHCNCVFFDREGRTWIGTNGGLNRLQDGRLTTVLSGKQGLLHDWVVCLAQDSSGHLWIGTWGGLHKLAANKLTAYTKEQGLSDNHIKSVLAGHQGILWVGTEKGLNRLDTGTGKVTVFTAADGLSANAIGFIFRDSRDRLWIGTDRGLDTCKDGVITSRLPAAGVETGLFRCAYEDGDGVVWVGSNSGLFRFEEGKDAVRFTAGDGLVENHIYSILEDDRGYLWLAGRKGISRIAKKELTDLLTGKIASISPDSYDERDGMASPWCTGHGCKTGQGELRFPTLRGVTTIDPDRITDSRVEPPLIIKTVIVDGSATPIHDKGRSGTLLQLDPGTKRVEFLYRAISFIKPKAITYRVKLEGYDDDWLDMADSRSTAYTGLSPGRYTFRVTAAAPGGQHHPKGVFLSLHLKPYFWQTGWFILSAVLAGLISAFFIYRLRVRRLKAREKELTILVDSRTRDLQARNVELESARKNIEHSKELIETKNRQLEEQTTQLKEQSEKLRDLDKAKSRFFANISHEFRTPLTLIMGPIEQMLADCKDKQQEEQLDLMLRSSRRLLNLINQLLDLATFDSGKMTLHAARHDIVSFLKGMLDSFEFLADQKRVAVTFTCPNEPIFLYFDAEKMEKIIGNLLVNAVKFTPAEGKIEVTVKKTAGNTVISVQDTGVGIGKEKLPHIFDRFYHADHGPDRAQKGTGIGLALTRELVELHHGTIAVHSKEGAGTQFVVKLPLDKKHLKPEEISESADSSPGQREIAAFWDALPAPASETEEEAHPDGEVKRDKNLILIVEDNADVRKYIRSPLQKQFRTVEAKDGKEGIDKAKRLIPDLIISDIMMPGSDGYELCKALKEDIKTSHIPIILLTAKASEESIVRGLKTRADDYITKPFNPKILLARVENLIELRRQLQEKIQREMLLQPADIAVSGVDREFINDLQAVIEKNLSDPDFGIEQICKKLYLGRTSLFRKVEALTGETPNQFLQSYRLKRAAQLLKANFGNVTQVAFEVGFSSTPYFTKCFKEKFHQLPSTFQSTQTPPE